MSIQGEVVGAGLKGKVKWFSSSKGFGFITSSEADGDVFVHYTSIQGDGFKTLKENDTVEYTLVNTDRGLQASDVVIV